MKRISKIDERAKKIAKNLNAKNLNAKTDERIKFFEKTLTEIVNKSEKVYRERLEHFLKSASINAAHTIEYYSEGLLEAEQEKVFLKTILQEYEANFKGNLEGWAVEADKYIQRETADILNGTKKSSNQFTSVISAIVNIQRAKNFGGWSEFRTLRKIVK